DHGYSDEKRDQASAQDGHDGNHQNEKGEGHGDVEDAHQYPVDPAAVVARKSADGGADDKGDEHGNTAHEQVDTRPPEHAGEDIATEIVGAEPVRHARRLQYFGEYLFERVV